MTEKTEDITFDKLEAFLQEMASATIKPVPLEKSREKALINYINTAKAQIQNCREIIATNKSKILAWEIELEKVRRGY